MKINDTLEICRTGKLEQYYTLYCYRFIFNDTFSNQVYYFMQNLSVDEKQAMSKALQIKANRETLYENRNYSCQIDIVETHRKEFCDLQAFGIKWKKSAKGFYINLGAVHSDTAANIFTAWRKDKDLLKAAGFSLFKTDNGWLFFFKNCSNEEMADKLNVLRIAQENKEIDGSYIGKIKERIKINCTVKSIKECHTKYGISHLIVFKTADNAYLNTFYSGTKNLPEMGQKINLIGTVKAHKEFNGQAQTVLNRVTWK